VRYFFVAFLFTVDLLLVERTSDNSVILSGAWRFDLLGWLRLLLFRGLQTLQENLLDFFVVQLHDTVF
jgi:hypothetical protein